MSEIDEAFRSIHREDFIADENRPDSARVAPIAQEVDQVRNQPNMVKQMLHWLDPKPGEKVLDIGAGSGWTTALLSHLVKLTGAVYAVERIPELLRFGQRNIAKISRHNVYFFRAGNSFGLPNFAPYDRILVSASVDDVPEELLDQLKVGGKLVIAIKDEIKVIYKTSKTDHRTETHHGFNIAPQAT